MSLWMLFLRGNDNSLVFAQITENRCAVKLIPLICINRCIRVLYLIRLIKWNELS